MYMSHIICVHITQKFVDLDVTEISRAIQECTFNTYSNIYSMVSTSFGFNNFQSDKSVCCDLCSN